MFKTFFITLFSLLISTQLLLAKESQPKYTQEKDENIRAVRECKSYQQLRPSFEKSLSGYGQNADVKEYPFMALLYYKNGDSIHWLCGGTLISNKFVLTAAHCFFLANSPNFVRLGELDYSTDKDGAQPVDIAIKNTTTHPQYFTTDIQSYYDDIALVELASEVQYNDHIMPACLSLADGLEFPQYLAAGWSLADSARNRSSHLRKVKLDRFDYSTCSSKVEITDKLEFGINNRTQMCAGSFTNNRGTCISESGSPLFVDHPDYNYMYLVLGITSFDDGGCGNVGYPAVFTRIASYLEWIEQIVWKESTKLS